MASGSQTDSQDSQDSKGSHGSQNRVTYADDKIPFTQRHMRIGKCAATIWAWGAFITALLTCVFHTLALATPEWVNVENIMVSHTARVDLGLWQECLDNGRCVYTRIDQISHAQRTCQAFAIVVSLILAVDTCLITIYILAEVGIRDARLILWSVGGRALTVFMFLIIVCVYATHWSDGYYSNSTKYTGVLGYSFALECTAVAIEGMGTVLSVMELKVILSSIEE